MAEPHERQTRATGGAFPLDRQLVGLRATQLQRLCCVVRSQAMLRRDLGRCWSDGGSEFVECGGQPKDVGAASTAELVVAAAEVLDEGVPSDHHARRSIGLQPPHRSEPGLQPAVVAFDPVVLVLAGVVQRGRNRSSITFANAGARSVTTSSGSP